MVEEIKLRRRNDDELKGYAQGYRDSFEKFKECLKVRPLRKAVEMMGLYVKTIENSIYTDEVEERHGYM